MIVLEAGITEKSIGLFIIESPEPEPPEEINIHGYIRDSISMEPIANTYVTINGIHASSQSDGLYWVYHMEPSLSVIISIEADGYEPYEEEVQASKVMNVDIVMIALEPPEPLPPVMEFQLTGITFSYIRNNHVSFGCKCVPVGPQGTSLTNSNIRVGFDREVRGQLSVAAEMTNPKGEKHTFRNSIDFADYAKSMRIAYSSWGMHTEGEYIWKVNVTSDGVLVAYNEFAIIGTKEPWNCAQAIEDYYNEEHSPTPIFGTGTLEGYVTKNGVPRKAKIMLGSTNPIDGGFDYMISSNSDTSGHYKIDNIKLNLVNEFIRYEVLVTSNYSRLWKGAVDIYEGENNLNIEV